MRGVCEVTSHGVGTLGPVIRETEKAEYRDRVCTVCGRVQGIVRIVKK